MPNCVPCGVFPGLVPPRRGDILIPEFGVPNPSISSRTQEPRPSPELGVAAPVPGMNSARFFHHRGGPSAPEHCLGTATTWRNLHAALRRQRGQLIGLCCSSLFPEWQ